MESQIRQDILARILFLRNVRNKINEINSSLPKKKIRKRKKF